MTDSVQILTPVGRLVQGDLYKGNDKDAEGKPLVVKTGPNAGQPRLDYFFALAIAKGGEQHWAYTDWGKQIWETGCKAFPNGQTQHPSFAWKITDGDSTIPNKKGRKPCDREGYPGHWILSVSSGYPPKIYNRDGSEPITEPGAVKLGYYVQAYLTVAGNGSAQQPGVYLNHGMVALAGYGKEIVVGPDASAVGFGQAALPAGASAMPIGGMSAPPATPPVGGPGTPLPTLPAVAPQPVPGTAGAPLMTAPPTTPPVTPHPGFLTPGAANAHPGPVVMMAAPPPIAAPPAAPVRQMLPTATATYEQYIAAGWNDAQLVQHGLMAQ